MSELWRWRKRVIKFQQIIIKYALKSVLVLILHFFSNAKIHVINKVCYYLKPLCVHFYMTYAFF